jgi:hypothetical protein
MQSITDESSLEDMDMDFLDCEFNSFFKSTDNLKENMEFNNLADEIDLDDFELFTSQKTRKVTFAEDLEEVRFFYKTHPANCCICGEKCLKVAVQHGSCIKFITEDSLRIRIRIPKERTRRSKRKRTRDEDDKNLAMSCQSR